MDQQNITFYEKNKNSADLIYPYADGIVIYRKIVQTNGTVQIVEIKKYDDQKEQTIRNVPEHEMSAETFDYWKSFLLEESHEYKKLDDRTTRRNISIENLLETSHISEDTLSDEALRTEEIAKAKRKKDGTEIYSMLTPIQRERYWKYHVEGMSTHDIAESEGSNQKSVWESISSAEQKVKKLRKKKGYSE